MVREEGEVGCGVMLGNRGTLLEKEGSRGRRDVG